MKKIMFNDRYGLTEAVLKGRKTMTRRIVQQGVLDYYLYEAEDPTIIDAAKYEIGEIVAVAQRYKDIPSIADVNFVDADLERALKNTPFGKWGCANKLKGWNNKMFVRADLMPHQIRITDIKVQYLQDISNEDCLKEGIRLYGGNGNSSKDFPLYGFDDYEKKIFHNYATPRETFANLIDKVSGKGTWDSNPYCFCYEFELID